MEELISVIIPVYNVEKYLKNAVKSVLNQTYKNLEVILIDDGSKDQSGVICEQLKQKDKRISVIHQENAGLSKARNVGIDKAKGKYLAFMDSDDYISFDTFEYLYKLILNYQVKIAQTEFLRIDDKYINNIQNILDKENTSRELQNKVIDSKTALDIFYGPKEFPYVQEVVVCNKLFKRELFEQVRFPEGRFHEDEFTTYKLLYNTPKIAVSNKVTYGYIQSSDSIMRKMISFKRMTDNLEAYEQMADFFKGKNLKEIEAKARRKYLEYCIELSGKIQKENSDDKVKKLNYLIGHFKSFYEENITNIKQQTTNELENQHINLIDIAYQKQEISSLWEELKKMIS